MEDKDKKSNPGEPMTPEERLFKVISTGGRGPNETEDDKRAADLDQDPFLKWEKVFQRVKDFFSISLERLTEISQKEPGAPALRRRPHPLAGNLGQIVRLKTLNKGLILFVALLTFYLIFDSIFLGRRHAPPFSISDAPVLQGFKGEDGKYQTQDLSHYLNPASARNVFLPPLPPAVSSGAPAADAAPVVQAPPVNIKLVGISWDDAGYVAMIELEGEKAARFVRKGDVLPSGVKVEDIKEYAASLSQSGRKWDLT